MNIDINKIISFKIPLEGYFILHCLHNDEKYILTNYVKNVNKIPTKVFLDLIKDGYLIVNESDSDNPVFTIDNIEITDKFKLEVLKILDISNLDFSKAFEQLREYYPTKVPSPSGGPDRRLHADIDRCKKLYSNIIMKNGIVDVEKHNFIIQCIKYEINERVKGKNLSYMNQLPKYLHQKLWELVEDDVKKSLIENGNVEIESNVNNKTMFGSKEF